MERIFCISSVFLSVFRLFLWPNLWSFLENITLFTGDDCVFCFYWVKWSGWFIVLFKSSISLLMLCLQHDQIGFCYWKLSVEVWNCECRTVSFSLPFCWFWLHVFWGSYWMHIRYTSFSFLMDWPFYQYIMSFLSLVTVLPAQLSLLLFTWNIFSFFYFHSFVSLYLSRSPIDSIQMDHFF